MVYDSIPMTIRLLSLLAFLAASCSPRPSDPRPNILFLFSDDHSVAAISAYGSRVNATPNLDRIAAEGMLFRNAFVTNAICAPSRAVILTGKYSHRNGQLTNEETFDGSQQTFPKLLQGAGYQTALFGKWHLGSEPTGFDRWEVLIGQGPYYNPPMITPSGIREHQGYTTDVITELALDWLNGGRDPAKPFLLMLQHKAPHRYWDPGPDHLTLYDEVTIPEPPTLFDDWSGKGTAAKRQTMTIARDLDERDLKLVPPEELTPEQLERWEAAYGPKNAAFREAGLEGDDLVRWKYQRYVKDYLRAVASVDDNVGRVLDFLDASGLSRSTIVVYASDQGWFLGEHGWFDKRFMYEESLRFPLLVRWPGVVAPGSESPAMVSNLDLAETFLDAAGVSVPGDMQGESLRPLLEGKAPSDWRLSFYYHYYEYPGWHDVARHYGVRTETHKLIHFYTLGEWELYDLESDPDELRNAYDDPANGGLVKDLKAELERLRERYGVPEDARPTGE
jgi:arylsulfatase A-like enzyme